MLRERTAAPRIHWLDYKLGLRLRRVQSAVAAALAEPALMAVAIKADEVSGGTVPAFGLRLAVALRGRRRRGRWARCGSFTGIPMPLLIGAGYAVVALQTHRRTAQHRADRLRRRRRHHLDGDGAGGGGARASGWRRRYPGAAS